MRKETGPRGGAMGVLLTEIGSPETSRGMDQDLEERGVPGRDHILGDKRHLKEGVRTSKHISRMDSEPQDPRRLKEGERYL